MTRNTPTWLIVTISSATSALVMLLLTLGLTALAEDSELDASPRTIPYNGVLEFNGAPYEGVADIEFTISDNEGCDDVHTISALPVQAGRFNVNIGGQEGVDDCLFDAEVVTISVAVRDPAVLEDEDLNNDGFIPLAGAQRIHPVPFAYWAAEGNDFKVDGTGIFEGNIFMNSNNSDLGGVENINRGGLTTTFGGEIAVGTINGGGAVLSTGGNLAIGVSEDTDDGNLFIHGSTIQFGLTDGRNRGDSGQQRALVHDFDDSDTLIINRSGDFEGGVKIESDTRVAGDLVVNNDLVVNGNLGQVRIITCAGAGRCACDVGEAVVGGGASASSGNTLSASRPSFDDNTSTWGWNSSCKEVNFNIESTVNRTCANTFAICMKTGVVEVNR